jgi:NAD(P)-dependent dehydrogenase (short-subunit alcohol dehydrogenase family)
MASYGFSTDGNKIVSEFSSEVKGRTFLITGPSQGGIGAETAISLAHGSPSTIVLLGRSLSKIQLTIDSIHSINSSISTKFVSIDLDSLSSVRAAAKIILDDLSIAHIDVVINNAAIMACPYGVTEDGFEIQFATNHLSHFLLTNLLMPKILAAGPNSRIINVSSWGHFASDIHYDDIGFNNGKDYSAFQAYGQSKTANILFSVGLNQKLNSRGIKSFALHPGSIRSNLQKYVTPEMMQEGVKFMEGIGMKMPERKTLQQGCSTTLRAALDPSLGMEGSVFLADCQLTTDPLEIRAYALDKEKALQCWAVSEDLVGEKFEY